MIDSAAPTGKPAISRVLAVLVGIALVLLGVLVGVLLTPRGDASGSPLRDSLEVGFAQDMSVHHNQAIEMSAMAFDRSTDPVVRTLAYDVLTSQQSQVGMMQGWLALWGTPSVSDTPMTWMPADSSMPGHDMTTMNADAPRSMPGMATSDELALLRRSSAEQFDGLYLQLLRRHHQGGIPMAQYGAENAAIPAVATLAQSIASTQAAEIDQIDKLMTSHGVIPLSEN